MKITKLVLGIITVVLSCFVVFQSCAAGMSNTLSQNGESGGTGGFLVAILMLAGGIVMIASRKNISAGGSVAGIVIFVLAALIGFATAGSYSDLKIWAVFCIILTAINFIALIKRNKNDSDDSESK